MVMLMNIWSAPACRRFYARTQRAFGWAKPLIVYLESRSQLLILGPRLLRAKRLLFRSLQVVFPDRLSMHRLVIPSEARDVLFVLLLFAALTLSSCGYHVAGRSSELPKSIHVIAVPAMENKTTTFKVEQKLTAATIHEFLAKTTYKITSDPNGGDAVLDAKVLSVEVLPLLFQSTTTTNNPTQPPQPNAQIPAPQIAQATAMTVTMRCEVTLTERDTEKVLYHTDNFIFRNQYQLASTGVDPTTGQPITSTKAQVESFFQEGDPALDRMAHDFASRLVSAVLENF